MIRSVILIALLVRFGYSTRIPSNVIEMANRPAWQNTHYYGNTERNFEFEGFLKQGGQVRFRSALYEDSAGEYLTLDTARSFFGSGKADTVRHRPADFDSLIGLEIEVNRDGNDTVRHPAMVHDGHWLFPVLTGKISVFARSPGERDYAYMELPGRGIEKYRDSTLVRELEKKEGSSAIIRNERLCKMGALLMFLGGGAMLAGGLLSSDEEKTDEYGRTEHEFNPSPLIGAGLAVMAGSIVPFVLSRGQLEEAIQAYNER